MKKVTHFIGLVSILLGTGLHAQNIPSYVPSSNLIGWWPLNGNGSDLSGNGNNLTLLGPTADTNREGNINAALAFNGSIGSAQIAKLPTLPSISSNGFSYSIWIKTDAFNTPVTGGSGISYQNIFCIAPSTTLLGPATNLGLYQLNNSALSISNWTTTNPLGQSCETQANSIVLHNWHHVVGSYNGDSLKLYLDGQLQCKVAANFSLLNQNQFLIGGYPSGVNSYVGGFQGSMDDFGFWNTVLTEDQVLDLYYGSLIHHNKLAICNGESVSLSTSLLESLPTKMPSNLADSLLLWMPVNGTLVDESPNGNTILNTGATLGSGRNGVSNSGIQLNGNAFLKTTSPLAEGQVPMTFSFWALSNSASSQDVLGQFCGTDCGSDIRIQLNTAQCGAQGLGFKSPAHFALAPASYDTSWHHYALVMGEGGNYSYQNFKFYIDGVQVLNTCGHNWGGWTYSLPSFPFIIGKGSALGANFDGLLDEIAVWKRALSSTEITQVFQITSSANQAFTEVLWSTGEFAPQITVSPKSTTDYWVSKAYNGLTKTDSITIFRINALTNDPFVCAPGDSVMLFASGTQGLNSATFQWSNGSSDDTTYVVPNQTSTYWLTSTIGDLTCVDSVQIFVKEPFDGIINDKEIVCSGESTQLWTSIEKINPTEFGPSSTLNDSILLWMPFNGTIENEGGQVQIRNIGGVLGQGHNQVPNGALYLDGNAYLTTDSALIVGQHPMTFSFWALSNSNSSQDVMGQFCGTDCGSDVRIQLNTAQCGSQGLGFKSPAHFALAPQPYDTAWHHYALVMGDGGSFSYQYFKFYIDGELVAVTCGHNWGGWSYSMPNFPFMIGKGAALGSNYEGLLDDIGVWNRALSEEEILELIALSEGDFQAFTQILWSTGEFTPSIEVSPTSTQSYWLRKQIDNCTEWDTVKISKISIQASQVVLCYGESATLEANGWNQGDSPQLYWSTGDSANAIVVTPTETTTYYLYSTYDGVSCLDSINIYVNDARITANKAAYCSGDTAILSALDHGFPSILPLSSSLADSLLIWLPFNNSIEDVGPNNLAITNTNGLLGVDRNNGNNSALYLDGNAYLTTDSALIVGQHPMTFSFWALSNSNSSQDVMGQFCGTDCGSDVRIQLNTAQCGSQGLGFKSPAHFALAPQPYDTAWHHYALVMGDGGSFSYQYFKFYIDGELVAVTCSHNWGGWSYSMPNFPFMIGKGAALGSNYEGLLDDIGVWNRALSQEEVQQVMSLSNGLQGFKTFTWSTGETTSEIKHVSDSTELIWLRTEFQGISCYDTLSVYRSIPNPTITSKIMSNSQATSVLLTAMEGYSYTWNTGQVGDSIYVYPSTTSSYWLQVVDTVGCASHDTITVETSEITFLVNLYGQDIDTVNGIHIAGNFQGWNPGSTAMVHVHDDVYAYTRGLVIGDTAIQFKFINGNSWNAPHDFVNGTCSVGAIGDRRYSVPNHKDTLEVVQLSSCLDSSPIDVLVDVQPLKCVDELITLDAGNTVWNVIWNTGDSTSSITVKAPGKYYFRANYYAGYPGINVYDTTIVGNFISVDTSLTVVGSLTFCSSSQVQLQGISANSYQWNTGDTGTTLTITQPGSFYAYVTSADGCLDTTSIFVTDHFPSPDTSVVVSGSLSFCSGSGVTLTAATGQSYLWSTGDTTQSITSSQSGSYYAIVTTPDGCTDTTALYTTTLYSDPDTSVTASGSMSFCSGSSVTLTAASGQSYLWNTGDTTQSITSYQSGTYYAVVTTGNGCTDTTATYTTTLYADPDTSVTASGSLAFCPGSSVTLTAASGQSYLWNTGDTTQSITSSQGGTYYAVVTTVDGCVDTTATYGTTLYSNPNTSLTASATTICASDSATITAQSGYAYLWNTGDTTQSITTSLAGSYSVTLTTTDGCSDTSSAMVIAVVPDVVLPPIIGNIWGWFGQGDTTNLSTVTNPSYNLTWVVNGGTIISGQGTDNIDVIWGGPDSNAIVWLIIDNGVCSDSTSIQVIVSGVGLEDQRVERVRLYPNPNDGYFTLEVSAAMLGGYYEVVDGLGRVMDRGEVTSLTQGFNLSNKPKGVYRIVVNNNGKTTTEIVVIQ